MKKTLIALALLSSFAAAQAGTVGYLPNTEGGTIRFTDDTINGCRSDEYLVVSVVPNGNYSRGCWKLVDDDNLAQVRWVEGSGNTKLYNANAVRLTPYGNAQAAKFDRAEQRRTTRGDAI